MNKQKYFFFFSASFEFANDDEPDDKRLATGRYAINIIQCELCSDRQKSMCLDFFIRKNEGEYILAFMQCVTCISGKYFTMLSKKTKTTNFRK